MVKAIITELRTGTIKNVQPKGADVHDLTPPYVIVWKDKPTLEGNRGTNGFYISAHFPKGNMDALDDYIENEVVTLLAGKTLVTRDGRNVPVIMTGEISPIVIGNDDGTISKDRLIKSPALY